ncbi:MAG: ABC transporter ATP-binding protein [Candidatus Latescibacteria bacterium]|nr:ABC transporter ATP-binding protein [Candidatus Latescibacterota bacterium]
MKLLELEDLHVRYGAVHALKGISLSVEEGEIATLVGANGAGKSTTLRAISGLVRPSGGRIRFRGASLGAVRAHEIVRLGISHVPEGRIVFANLTVLENLEMGAYLRRDRGGVGADLKRLFQRFPRLEERRRQSAGTLSGGEQQMLAIGRALMARPTVLLMDEPSLGLAPILVREIFSVIREIRSQGTTIVLVEQNARMALATADVGYVLETGMVRMSDRARALLESPFVQAAYLGGAG